MRRNRIFRKLCVGTLCASMLLGTLFVTANADGNEEVCRIGESYILSSNDPYDGGSNGWALISHGVGEGLFMLDEEAVQWYPQFLS